jgi:hypothetical protein
MSKTDVIVNIVYDVCVEILIEMAKLTGFTYREVNVILFCIVMPAVYVLMSMIILYQWYRIYRLKHLI